MLIIGLFSIPPSCRMRFVAWNRCNMKWKGYITLFTEVYTKAQRTRRSRSEKENPLVQVGLPLVGKRDNGDRSHLPESSVVA